MMVYCDSAVLIYYLDTSGGWHELAASRLDSLAHEGSLIAITDLTRLECRTGPIKRADASVLAEFDRFFTAARVRLIPLTSAIWDKATIIRATYGFKTADALHLAAAVAGGCQRFLTNDIQMRRFTEIPVDVLT